jgi:hypothetical protein
MLAPPVKDMTDTPSTVVLPTGARLYHFADRTGGALLLAQIVIAPWLFGATENWSILFLNLLAYTAGLLMLFKWIFRWRTGALAVEGILGQRDKRLQPGAWVVRGMATLTLAVLFYCLVSALNARATYDPALDTFTYHRYVPWLPFTYDSTITWRTFCNYFALACLFWGLRDWLLHPPRPEAEESEVVLGLPPRFRILFWTITLSASLLAVEALFQKLSGTEKLLWLRPMYAGRAGDMFGPFAFRGNAAQYFNLAWPLILGFWWSERERSRLRKWTDLKVGGAPHTILLLCTIVTAAAPIIASSIGGTLVTLGLLAFSAFVFVVRRGGTWRTRCTILLVCVAVLALGGALGWDQVAPRLRALFRTPYANPNELYANAQQMALDYPLFGIGPGAFRVLYPLYRTDLSQPWQAFLHDDWLETRVTFGWVGSMLILSLLGLALTRWFLAGGVASRWEIIAMLWIGIGGCLLHAKFSFPLQVYSILGLLLVELAVLSCLSRPEN